MEDNARLALLKKAIQFNTANGNEAPPAQWLQQVLAEHGIPSELVEFAPHRAGLVAEIGTGQEPILAFAGHLDTVAPNAAGAWQTDPFAAAIHDGAIYGRGAVDMKGGLIATVIALIELHAAGLPKAGTIRLLLSGDEEGSGTGATALTQRGYLAGVKALVMAEASSQTIEYAHCGSFDYIVHARGKAVHSSTPALGHNALMDLIDFINAEQTAFDEVDDNPVLGALVHSITVLHGGEQLNTIPDAAFLKGNVRTIPECDNQATHVRLQAIIDRLNQGGAALELEVVGDFAPVVTDPSNPFITQVQAAVKEINQVDAPVVISKGATDASMYVKGNPDFAFVEYGPGDDTQSHQVNEHLNLAEFLAAPAVYQQIAHNFFAALDKE